MSTWTHVNGSIRVDAIRISCFKNTPLNLGIESQWEDDHDASDIPTGSEGSLVWTKWENPSKNALAAYTVNFFGDLRDYDDVAEIEKYLDQIVEGQIIRSGICEISVEFSDTIVYRYNSDTSTWDKIVTIPYKEED